MSEVRVTDRKHGWFGFRARVITRDEMTPFGMRDRLRIIADDAYDGHEFFAARSQYAPTIGSGGKGDE